MPVIITRILAAVSAATWLVFPGFGLIDLSVSWDADWPVVLEASWGAVMTVLVAGSFLTIALRPRTSAPAVVILLVTLASSVISAVAGLEGELLGYAALLAAETGLVAVVQGRERLRPVRLSVGLPLLVLGIAGAVPWAVHAARVYRLNRANLLEVSGDITMGVDHYAVQGGMALAVVTLTVLAAVWPRGRRFLGVGAGVVAGYVGLVSLAFPATEAGFAPVWSVLAMAWGAAVAVLAGAAPWLQPGQLRREVVEAERAL